MAGLSAPTWRLVPSQYPPISAFELVATPDDLDAVLELEGWTNDRLVAERLRRLPKAEWVYGRANASVVMAAFLHASPEGQRFSGPDLGAWYAAIEFKTAVAEVAHHRLRAAVASGQSRFVADYRAYAARLAGDYDDLRGQQRPELYDPNSYAASQPYGEGRRAAGSDGLVYDSVRLKGGTNAVAFRPSNVRDVVESDHWRISAGLQSPPAAQRLGR